MPHRNPQEVAKQFATYADSVAAFSLAQAIVFAIALGTNDFRGMVRDCPIAEYIGILVFNLFYVSLLAICHHVDNQFLGKPDRKDLAGYWAQRGRQGRWAVIILATFLSLVAMYLINRDVSICHCVASQPSHAQTPAP